MITKVYEKMKNFIKENKFFLFTIFFIITISYIPLPYYIYAPGGVVDVEKRFDIENAYPSKGSFNMAYVSEYRATVPTYLLALLKKDWDIVSKEEVVAPQETEEENLIRNKYLLEEANQDAVINAFSYANKKCEITKEELYITYVDEIADTDLKIGDQILSLDNKKVRSKEELQSYLQEKEIGAVVIFEVLRDNKVKTVTGKVQSVDGEGKIGIVITSNRTLKTVPQISFHFKKSESGPSGGLMMSLAIYNNLVKEDITKGLKIAGTGTISENGDIGEIGGIEYKIMGAEKAGADLFFAPSGKNYEDAIKIAKKNNYKIKIVEVEKFEDAINFLKQQ